MATSTRPPTRTPPPSASRTARSSGPGTTTRSVHFADNARPHRRPRRPAGHPGLRGRPRAPGATGFAAVERRPRPASPACTRRSTPWPRTPAPPPPRSSSARAGTRPSGPSSGRSPARRSTGPRTAAAPTSAASTCTPPWSARASSTPARRWCTPRGTTPAGSSRATRTTLAREGLFRLLPPSAREDAILRRSRTPPGTASAWSTSSAPRTSARPEDLAISAALTARATLPEVVGYWGELGAVDTAVALGCAGQAGDLCMDGSVGSRTPALHAPYADAETSRPPLPRRRTGHATTSSPAPAPASRPASTSSATAPWPRSSPASAAAADPLGAPAIVQARHRLEHVEMASPAEMAALGELGVTASMQPMFDGYWGGADSLYAAAPRRRARPADEPLRLDEPRRASRWPSAPTPRSRRSSPGAPSAPPPGTTPRPSGSPCGRRSTRTPAAAGARPGATRAA